MLRQLRVGLVAPDGRVAADQVVPAGAPVTVGSDPGCFFVVDGPGVPVRFPLLVRTGGAWRLRFDDGIVVHVAAGAGDATTRGPFTGLGLIERGLATRDDDAWSCPLDEETRGKASIGRWAIVFKFVYGE